MISRFLIVPLLALAGACVSTSETRWVKPDATDATIARNVSDCSAVAWTEAERINPSGPQMSTPGALDPAALAIQQKVDAKRFEDAKRLNDLCMENRGFRMQELQNRPMTTS